MRDTGINIDCPKHGQQPITLYDFESKAGCKGCVNADDNARPLLDIAKMINGMDWKLPDGSLKRGRRS